MVMRYIFYSNNLCRVQVHRRLLKKVISADWKEEKKKHPSYKKMSCQVSELCVAAEQYYPKITIAEFANFC